MIVKPRGSSNIYQNTQKKKKKNVIKELRQKMLVSTPLTNDLLLKSLQVRHNTIPAILNNKST